MQKYLILACCFLIFNARRSQARSIEYDTIGESMAKIPADAYNKRSSSMETIGESMAKIPDYATIPADDYNKRSKTSAQMDKYEVANHFVDEIRMGMKDIDIRPVLSIPSNIALRPIETIGKKSAIADYATIPAEDIYKKSVIDKIGKNMAMIPDYAAIPADAYSMRSRTNIIPTEFIYEME